MRPRTNPSRHHELAATSPASTGARPALGGQPRQHAGPRTARQTGHRPATGTAQQQSYATTAAAATTVALVLADDSPLPETDQDVQDLMALLRGHIGQLGVIVPAEEPALLTAQQLGTAPVPDTYMDSRVHLCSLAEAVKDLVAAAEHSGVSVPARKPGWPWPLSRNTVRVLVFAAAVIVLAIAVCIPQT